MLTEDDLKQIEREANEVVWENREIRISFPPEEELEQIPYRSKKALTGSVRIVTIENADICACCGTHVTRTGEIGLIKIFSCVKFHEGVRLEILCGMRAYEYVNLLIEQNRKIRRCCLQSRSRRMRRQSGRWTSWRRSNTALLSWKTSCLP